MAIGDQGRSVPTTDDVDFSYFLKLEPTDRVGWSIYIYNITLAEANRVRKQLGLTPIY